MNDFVPQKWATVIRATEDQLRPLSFGFVRRDVNGNLPTRTVETPRTPEWLAARTTFIEQWQAMTEQGLAAGFLEQETCYECPGVIEPTEDTVVRTYEPNPDYVAPPPMPDTFRIPRA